jgi:hypothetical protein
VPGVSHWTSGYSRSELDEAQERYRLRFPPDLVELLLDRRPVRGYAWHTEDHRIREMLEWPFELLRFDVEHGLWWGDWGECPATAAERTEVLRSALRGASRLIPLIGHRFLPETPGEAGNPVFSMHGFDTIYYGADLADFFRRQFCPERSPREPVRRNVRHIPFWSDVVEKPDRLCYPK